MRHGPASDRNRYSRRHWPRGRSIPGSITIPRRRIRSYYTSSLHYYTASSHYCTAPLHYYAASLHSSSFLSIHQESYVRQIVPSQCLAQSMAMSLAVVRSWGEQAVSIMGQTSMYCMVCLIPQSQVFVRWKIPTSTCSLLTGQPVYAAG